MKIERIDEVNKQVEQQAAVPGAEVDAAPSSPSASLPPAAALDLLEEVELELPQRPSNGTSDS